MPGFPVASIFAVPVLLAGLLSMALPDENAVLHVIGVIFGDRYSVLLPSSVGQGPNLILCLLFLVIVSAINMCLIHVCSLLWRRVAQQHGRLTVTPEALVP